MKKIKLNVYFLVVFFMTITYSFAQSNYLPLLNINNQWNILRRGANPYINYTEIFKIDKDTIINEKSCKRIMKSTDSSSNAIYNFAYYMYEDTITKKIYTLDNNFNQKLYFDFSANAGDTLVLYCPYYNLINADTFYVTQTDTFNIAGLYRKRISSIFKSGGISLQAEDWYEGIGTLKGLHYGGYPPYIGELMKLLCFKNNNQLIFENTSSYNCYYTNVGVNETELSQFSIYPNPVSDNLYINNFQSKNFYMQIFDIKGQLVFNQNLFEQNNSISISNLQRGIYFVVIYNNNNKVFTKKINKI